MSRTPNLALETFLPPAEDAVNDAAPASNRGGAANHARTIELADGAVATAVGRGLELRDVRGRLLVRYVDGMAEIAAPAGDLVLSAPEGRVVVQSAEDVEIQAGRDVVHRAGRKAVLETTDGSSRLEVAPVRTTLATPEVTVQARDATLEASNAVSAIARSLSTRAEHIAVRAEKYELAATRLFEKTRDAFREVADLAQTRAGRVRTVVGSTFSLRAGRTTITSKEDTSIDGRKVLLG
ncbi:MAG: DUF3540 domain-containing protein [Polyangiaceae bacterium]